MNTSSNGWKIERNYMLSSLSFKKNGFWYITFFISYRLTFTSLEVKLVYEISAGMLHIVICCILSHSLTCGCFRSECCQTAAEPTTKGKWGGLTVSHWLQASAKRCWRQCIIFMKNSEFYGVERRWHISQQCSEHSSQETPSLPTINKNWLCLEKHKSTWNLYSFSFRQLEIRRSPIVARKHAQHDCEI